MLFTEPKTMLMHRLEGWGQSQYQSYQERYNSQFYAQVGHHQSIKHPSNKVDGIDQIWSSQKLDEMHLDICIFRGAVLRCMRVS